MSIHNRRNSAVGYMALKAIQHKLNRKEAQERRRKVKIAAYIGLGLVSAGILAGLVAIALRRRDGDAIEALFTDDEIVGEVVTAPEPVPAT